MNQQHVARTLVAGGVAALALVVGLADSRSDDAKKDPAVERARKNVQMFDDIYKTAIVLVTQEYVDADSKMPAGRFFKRLFKVAKDKGYHEVRLIDATGEPENDENSPADDYEKEAIRALKAGKPAPEKIVEKNGKRFLRAATPVPVVLEKCVACHAHYKNAKKGEAIGAMVYIMPIE